MNQLVTHLGVQEILFIAKAMLFSLFCYSTIERKLGYTCFYKTTSIVVLQCYFKYQTRDRACIQKNAMINVHPHQGLHFLGKLSIIIGKQTNVLSNISNDALRY